MHEGEARLFQVNLLHADTRRLAAESRLSRAGKRSLRPTLPHIGADPIRGAHEAADRLLSARPFTSTEQVFTEREPGLTSR